MAGKSKKENPLVIVNNVLIDGKECSGVVTVPAVTTYISDYSFYNNEKVTKVLLPQEVEYIGSRVFEYCTGLEEVTIPSGASLETYQMFYKCTS